MTDEADNRQQAVAAIIQGVTKKTALILSVAVAALFLFNLFQGTDYAWWFLPLSVIFGGLLGVLNFRWLGVAVRKVYLKQGATPAFSNIAAAILHLLKLSIIFIILFIVIKWKLVQIFGLVAGLSICFIAIIWEGATVMKGNLNSTDIEKDKDIDG